jgi:antitoxin FitA
MEPPDRSVQSIMGSTDIFLSQSFTSDLYIKQHLLLTCALHANSIVYMSKMIQLRNVPDSLHRQLKARAALAGMALSDFLIREVRKIAEYPTPEEMRERLAQRDPYRGKLSPTDILRAERDSR